MTRIKWIMPKAKYDITRCEQTSIALPYRNSQTGKVIPGMTVEGIRIVGYAGDVAVIGVSVFGNHPMTLANYREVMARKIQDEGGSWIGRSHDSETAKADRLVALMTDPDVTPDPKVRRALKDAHFGNMPKPSDY